MINAEAQVCRRNAAKSAFRPFDKTHRSFIEIFVKAGIEKLLWGLEAIKIKVI